MTATYIPVQAALKTLAAAGHKVETLTRRQAMALGRWDALYVVDGTRYDLTGVRCLVADVGMERKTTSQTDKPRREIEVLAEVAAARTKNVRICTMGERNLNGQTVYRIEVGAKSAKWTLARIRAYLSKGGLI